MLKENLRMIFKNKLTWLVFLALIVVVVCFSLSYVYKEYNNFYNYIYDGRIVVKKPFAVTTFSRCEDVFGGVLILTAPVCLSFFAYRNDSIDNMVTLRGNGLRERIYRSLAIAIVTALFFFLAYAIGVLTFYLTLNPNMDPYVYDDFVNNTNYSNELCLSKEFMFYDLFWANKGNSTFFYYLFNGFLFSILMFTFIMLICSITMCFEAHMKVIVFVVSCYVVMFGLTYFFDNVLIDYFSQMPALLSNHCNYDGYLTPSWVLHPLMNIVLAAIIFFGYFFIERRTEKK